jgi:hypothetical protein
MSKPSDSRALDCKGKAQTAIMDRRSLFMMGGSAVAAVAVMPLAGGEARYKETEHVKTFYRVNRY